MKKGKPGNATRTRGGKLTPGETAPIPPREVGRSADWLDGGLALLDASHQILALNEALALWLGAGEPKLTGASFDQLLQGRCPESEPVLARAWAEAAPLAEYPFSAGSGPEQHWLRLEAARNSGGWFVRLSSILPPLRELMEEGGAQEKDFEKQQLRIRVLRAESQLDKLIQR